ncbi:hypothetical protein K340107D12_25920 [Blautia parvula]|uniref:Uncharacterized protein n=1 Tax=Blautia parvula TaxID=2877527 RepID=A0ABQ0BTA3_9FIRM
MRPPGGMCTGVLTDSKLAASVEGAGNNTMIGQDSGRIHYEKKNSRPFGYFFGSSYDDHSMRQ